MEPQQCKLFVEIRLNIYNIEWLHIWEKSWFYPYLYTCFNNNSYLIIIDDFFGGLHIL